MTAINSVIGLIVADANGLGPVVLSNERSSNVGNVDWMGRDINHQWSKSIHYETLLRDTLSPATGSNPDRYFSLLRGLSESEIADRFRACPEYFRVFISCNRPFALDAGRRGASWCGHCPKCLFVFVLMAPRLGRTEVEAIFGRNLFADTTIGRGSRTSSGSACTSRSNASASTTRPPSRCLSVLDDDEWRDLPLVEEFRTRRGELEAVATAPDRLGLRRALRARAIRGDPGLRRADPDDAPLKPDLAGLVVGIWGFGREGLSMARTAAAAGAARIDAVDDVGRGRLEVPGDIASSPCTAAPSISTACVDCDVVFVSPGVPWRQPVFAELRASGQRHLQRGRLVRVPPRCAHDRRHRHQGQEHHRVVPGSPAGLARRPRRRRRQHRYAAVRSRSRTTDAVVVAELSSQQAALLSARLRWRSSPISTRTTSIGMATGPYYLAKANVFRNGARSLVTTPEAVATFERVGRHVVPAVRRLVDPARSTGHRSSR